jgi:hypothetical protein
VRKLMRISLRSIYWRALTLPTVAIYSNLNKTHYCLNIKKNPQIFISNPQSLHQLSSKTKGELFFGVSPFTPKNLRFKFLNRSIFFHFSTFTDRSGVNLLQDESFEKLRAEKIHMTKSDHIVQINQSRCEIKILSRS